MSKQMDKLVKTFLSSEDKVKPKMSIFYTPKTYEEMEAQVERFMSAFPPEVRVHYMTVVNGVKQFYENKLSEAQEKGTVWL